MNLTDKINNLPHPWYGNRSSTEFMKSSVSKSSILTDGEQVILFPQLSWASSVRMSRAQLEQALAGNFMFPGEEEFRVGILVGEHKEKYGHYENYLNPMI
jgi:hypothetical protein